MYIGAHLFGFLINLLYSIVTHKEYAGNIFEKFFKSGSTFMGCFYGLIFLCLYCFPRFFKKKSLLVTDIFFLVLPLWLAIGKIGCFFSGCCYGCPTNFFLGVKFPYHGDQIHPLCNISVHPVQVYESILSLFNFFFLLYVYKNKKFDGQVVSLCIINYGIIRFFLEYFKGDAKYVIIGESSIFSLTIFQLLSLLLILFGTVLYMKKGKLNMGTQ